MKEATLYMFIEDNNTTPGHPAPCSDLPTSNHIAPEWGASFISIKIHQNILPDSAEAP
jgi:hypothetical protein